jgi:DNA repair exonuclease SbcCD ATPase subunit
MDNNYSSPINDKDKDTLHTAGVDIANNSSTEETLIEDKDSTEEKIIDIDGAVPPANDIDLKDSGIHFVEEETPKINKEDLSSLAEENHREKETISEDLEEEFRSELADIKSTNTDVNEKTVLAKAESLSELLSRIEEKLGHKKTEVKKELSSLKKMKDEITKDITEIKEMEASEEKIKNELNKIETIKKEVEAIEEEFKNENF